MSTFRGDGTKKYFKNTTSPILIGLLIEINQSLGEVHQFSRIGTLELSSR